MSNLAVTAIVTRLKAGFPDAVQCEEFPDKPAQKLRGNAALWVGYVGSRWVKRTDVSQDRTMMFDIGVLTRKLSGGEGSSIFVDSVVALLQGYTLPQGGTPIAVIDDRFVAYETGVWRYNVTVACTLPSVAICDEVEEAPALVRARFLDAFGGDFDVENSGT